MAVGTAIWAVLLLTGLLLRSRLAETGREWWIGTAAIGVFLGLVGYLLLRRRGRRQGESPDPPPSRAGARRNAP